MNFINAEELLQLCKENSLTISQAMLKRETKISGASREEMINRMTHAYHIMKEAVQQSLTQEIRSIGGLIGGEAVKINQRRLHGKPVCGDIISKAIAYAMGVLEVNASMGLIVAAPTAGSSGVIPGVFLAIQESFHFSEEEMVDALFNAGAVGYLITRNATVAGAEGGCQAEVGTASAMAASAVTQLMGGDPVQCLGAASTAITNILGLVCDPIGGLVEAPCQKRNAMGASNALISAEISLCGIAGIIPFDEVVDTMYKVGRSLPRELKETALGGIAATPTACSMCRG
ncbi:L-serine ammonia-lyase, iron-sulfur-dependent, subunit alpha [Sinanaerobacter chloroacetimidivorans]|jgi:L-serine dehydratase|uniref:L-serine dehydratase n=1 Tax=Sinanaerobacter chloroacetimidivorans TaxID=2818044 RepID=A0A8J7W6S4_9FIRM|nr:L-serine ammonia-lyase, iron-sulfur-dependent, subunit alpha [Sinanaerobacter chloroacetimidivorans]MBR0600195.1 L-serine ammonia-lyase, iron-sulfur-dependent, subunit alpha [Sinanaerobacter chloroacetimidivorans]